LLLLLASLLWYGKVYNPEITLQMCLASPERHDGAMINIGTEVTVAEVLPDGFVIRQMGRTIKVMGNAPGLGIGEFISLQAVFHRPGWLELKALHVARNRRAKIWTSVIPMALILGFFFHRYRFDWRRFEFRER
jgi:hypothetical protein